MGQIERLSFAITVRALDILTTVWSLSQCNPQHCWNMQINNSHVNRILKTGRTWSLTVAQQEPVNGLLQVKTILYCSLCAARASAGISWY